MLDNSLAAAVVGKGNIGRNRYKDKIKIYGICPRIFSNPFSPTAPTARSTICPL